MAAVSQEMILEYMRKKGGRVKNVDLVRNFRKHLSFEDKIKKEQARELFKETVNSVAVIRQEEGEKFLYLKDEFLISDQQNPASVQQKLPEPHPPSDVTRQKKSQSSNLGRPTALSDTRPLSVSPPHSCSEITPLSQVEPVVHVYENGIGEFDGMEEKSVSSTKRKSPVPAPNSNGRGVSLPPEVSNRSVSPPYHSIHQGLSSPTRSPYRSISPSQHNPAIGRIPEDQPGSPQMLFSSHHRNLPKVLSSPKKVSTPVPEASIQSTISSQNHLMSNNSQSPEHSYHPQSSLLNQSNVPTSNTMQSGTTESSGGKRIKISGPVSVTSFSNSLISANPVLSSTRSSVPYSLPESTVPLLSVLGNKEMSSMLEHYTSELENIGTSSPFTSPHTLSETGLLESTSHHHGSSETGAVGVQKLIQQYTVPLGAALNSPPSDSLFLSPSRQSKVGRSLSSVSNQSAKVVFRREHTPPDGKVQRSHSNAGNVQHRRSRLWERNSNLDTLTRQSIKGTHSVHRQSKSSDELLPSTSKEELLFTEDHDQDSPVHEREDDYACTFDIEPLEREWVQALISSNTTEIHRILLTDSSMINKKGFLHGWCALHWAVKNSNEEIIRSLIISGGKVDIRSNGGLTPLHIAAECGNENVTKMLVFEYNASTNIRDHSGRRPIDVLHPFAPENMRNILRTGLGDIPGFRNESLAIAMGPVKPTSHLGQTANAFHIPRSGTQSAATLRRNWSSTGHLFDSQLPDKASVRRSQLSPRVARKGFSFRRKKYQVNVREKRDSSSQSEYYEQKDS